MQTTVVNKSNIFGKLPEYNIGISEIKNLMRMCWNKKFK